MKDDLFGSSQCGINLVDILENMQDQTIQYRLRKKLPCLFNEYNEGLKGINRVQNKAIRKRLALLWRRDFEEQISKIEMPENIRTHFVNILVGVYRDWLFCEGVKVT